MKRTFTSLHLVVHLNHSSMDKKVQEKKKVYKISSGGRVIKPSRKLLISSDDEPKRSKKSKRSQSMIRMKQEMDRLRLIVKKFNTESDKKCINPSEKKNVPNTLEKLNNSEVIMCTKSKKTLLVPDMLSSALDFPTSKSSMNISENCPSETNLTHPTSSKVKSTASIGTILKSSRQVLTCSDESKRSNKSKSDQSIKNQELNRPQLMTKKLENPGGYQNVNTSEKENVQNTLEKLNNPEVMCEDLNETLSGLDEFSPEFECASLEMDISLDSSKEISLIPTSSKVKSAALETETIDLRNSNTILEKLLNTDKNNQQKSPSVLSMSKNKQYWKLHRKMLQKHRNEMDNFYLDDAENKPPAKKRLLDKFNVWSKRKDTSEQLNMRCKVDRAKLNGGDCWECREYYKNLSLSKKELQKRKNLSSRHRHKYERPNTPEGFWDPDFPET